MFATASQLARANKNGFTMLAYAQALAGGLPAWVKQGGKAPNTGFGTAAKPNGAAHAHATWPARAAQGYLVLAPTPAPKRKATAPKVATVATVATPTAPPATT